MKEQPEALRLADLLEKMPLGECDEQAAAELRRLHADAEESEALRERLSELLRNTAIALRGPEPELTRWSWHDLPELAAALKAQRDALLEAYRKMKNVAAGYSTLCDDSASTSKLEREFEAADAIARAAIKAVEEGK